MQGWWIWIPGLLIVIGWMVTFRWLGKLQGWINNLRERVARLEGRDEHRDDHH